MDDGMELYERALKCAQDFSCVLFHKVVEIEFDYEDNFLKFCRLGKADFAKWNQNWKEIIRATEQQLNTVSELKEQIDNGKQTDDYVKEGLEELKPAISALLQYASDKQKMFQRLENEANGERYEYPEYKRDHEKSEESWEQFVKCYNIFKKKKLAQKSRMDSIQEKKEDNVED